MFLPECRHLICPLLLLYHASKGDETGDGSLSSVLVANHSSQAL